MAPPTMPEKKKSPRDGTSPPTTRNSRSSMMQDDIESLPGAVTNIDSAEKYLASALLRQADEPLTLIHITGILFQITQMAKSTPLPVVNAIRAVAFILKQLTASEIAEAVILHLTDSVTTSIVNNVVAAISPQVAAIHSVSEELKDSLTQTTKLHGGIERERNEKEESLQTAAERIEDAVDMLYESIEDCNNSCKTLTPSLESTQDSINSLSTQFSQRLPVESHPTSPSLAHPTYSSIAATHPPPPVDQAVARAAIRAKQILLDPTPGRTLFAQEDTNSIIAKKISDMLLVICSANTPKGTVRAVQRLRNGGVIVELDNEQLASWLRSPTGRQALEAHLDASASVRDRTYAVVIQFLPITYEIDREDFPRLIENENKLPPNSIASIRWIKPPQRRSKDQRNAFALLQLRDANTANDTLKEGLCIDAQRYTVNKDKKEPTRCAKCQKFGHIARNCSAPHDTCGTCSGRHWTAQCNAFRTECCVNCKSQTHTSWSRKCPEFMRRCSTLDEMYPENKMPFFPTENSWTHASLPPKPPIRTPPHSKPSRLVNANLRTPIPQTKQTTLSFPTTSQPSIAFNPPSTPTAAPSSSQPTPNTHQISTLATPPDPSTPFPVAPLSPFYSAPSSPNALPLLPLTNA